MPKKLIQDIFVKEKPADINVPTKNVFSERRRNVDRILNSEPNEKISKHSHVFIWVICIIAVGTLLFFASSLFATATLTITPKSEPVALNDTYTISSSTEASGLHYQIVSQTQTLSQSLQTNGSQNVSDKAVGTAIIYNDYSSAALDLLINTKLETTSGLIYLTDKALRVPGIKTVNGVEVPGSIAVGITAAEPGAEYNMNLSDLKGDFTIPGLENTSKYTSFYGRLSSNVTGGYSGIQATISPSALSVGKTQLQNNLETALIKNIYSQNSQENVIFKNDYFITYTDLPDAAATTSYTISESATIYAVSFNAAELAAFIAKNKLGDYDGSPVNAIWNDDMSVSITGQTAEPWTENSLQATFSGDAIIAWTYDTSKILNEIAGQNKSILADIVSDNKPMISALTASIVPLWDNTFPKNPAKIKVIDTVEDAQ